MIFVSVGTERFPFDRLVRAADRLCEKLGGEEIFVQLGEGRYLPSRCRWVRFLPYEEMVEKVRAARIVVAHAGAGSILLCAQMGSVPVVLARRRRFGEHVNDHQVGLARSMAELGYVFFAEEEDQVVPLVLGYDRKRREERAAASTEPRLADTLSAYLSESQALSDLLRRHYGLEGPFRFTRPPRGYGSDTWRVMLPASPEIVLQRYPRVFKEPQIRFIQSLRRHLSANGLSVPVARPTTQGALFLEEGGRFYAVFGWISGTMRLRSWKRWVWWNTSSQVGRLLGRFHRLTESFRPEGESPSLPTDPTRLLQGLERRREWLAALESPTGFDQEVLSRLAALQGQVKEVGERLMARWSRLPSVVVHGDVGPPNLLFRGFRVAGFLDFNDSCRDARLTDLAYAVAAFCEWSLRGSDPTLHLGMARRLVRSYEAVCPLTEAEREVFADALIYARLRRLNWILDRYYDDPLKKASRWFSDNIKMLEWLEKARSQLQALSCRKH